MAGAFYWYFSYSQSKIDTLEQSAAKLTEAIQIQQQAMQDQQIFEQQQDSNLTDLQTQLQSANDAKAILEQKFLNTDLNSLAQKNAKALEDKINAATAKAIQDIENETNPGPEPKSSPKPTKK